MYNWLFIDSLSFVPKILPSVDGRRVRDKGVAPTGLEEISWQVVDTSRPDGSGIGNHTYSVISI